MLDQAVVQPCQLSLTFDKKEESDSEDYRNRWKRWAADIEFRLASFDTGVEEVLRESPNHTDTDHTDHTDHGVLSPPSEAWRASEQLRLLQLPQVPSTLFQLSPERSCNYSPASAVGMEEVENCKGDTSSLESLQLDDFDFSFMERAEKEPQEPLEPWAICTQNSKQLTPLASARQKEPLPSWNFDSLRTSSLDKFARFSAWSCQREVALSRLEAVLATSESKASPSKAPSPKRKLHAVDLHTRGQQWLEAKRAREHQLRENQREAELQQCPFQPQTSLQSSQSSHVPQLKRTRSLCSLYERQKRWQELLLEKRDRQRQNREEGGDPLTARPRAGRAVGAHEADAAFERFHERNRKWLSTLERREAGGIARPWVEMRKEKKVLASAASASARPRPISAQVLEVKSESKPKRSESPGS